MVDEPPRWLHVTAAQGLTKGRFPHNPYLLGPYTAYSGSTAAQWYSVVRRNIPTSLKHSRLATELCGCLFLKTSSYCIACHAVSKFRRAWLHVSVRDAEIKPSFLLIRLSLSLCNCIGR